MFGWVQNFVKKNRYAITLASVNLALNLLENYWVFTAATMNGKEKADNEGTQKFFYLLANLLFDAGKGAIIGKGVDCATKLFGSGDGNFFQQHKAAIGLAISNMTLEMLQNYWIFTSVPMIDDTRSNEVPEKLFYMLANLFLAGVQGSVMGIGVDRLLEGFNNMETNSETPLLKN